jgi:YidC/Oxa1 family membrane protein insertase
MITFANVLQPLIDLCEVVLEFFHNTVGVGWGLAIILMTFTIRLAILPLTFRGAKGMQEIQQLQPEMKRLQERHKGDRQRMQQETMKLYQEHGVNPLSSCLPILLQLPFFLALYFLLSGDNFAADLERTDPSFLFIPDLAAPPTGVVLGVLIAVYIATQLGSSMVSMISADPMQRRIFMALPFVFGIFILFYDFPAGLLVYWITTNVWTVGQQLLIRRMYPKPEPIDRSDVSAKPAHGKPVAEPAAATATAGAGNAAKAGPAKPPPSARRKRKKRSGRRR